MIRMNDDEGGSVGGIAAAAGITRTQVEEVEVMPAESRGVGGEIQLSGTPAGVRKWVDAAAQFSRAQTAAMVMAGFELAECKRSHGYVQGGVRGAARSSQWGTWEDFLREEIHISPDTASRWMRMAEAVKPRLRRLGGMRELMEDILSKPLAQLTLVQSEVLAAAVDKVADGRSQMEFLMDLGIAKRPQGSAAKGGDQGGAGAGRNINPESRRLIAMEDWATIASKLEVTRENFTLLEDPDLLRIEGLLEVYLRQIRIWNGTPKNARTADLVRTIAEALR